MKEQSCGFYIRYKPGYGSEKTWSGAWGSLSQAEGIRDSAKRKTEHKLTISECFIGPPPEPGLANTIRWVECAPKETVA